MSGSSVKEPAKISQTRMKFYEKTVENSINKILIPEIMTTSVFNFKLTLLFI